MPCAWRSRRSSKDDKALAALYRELQQAAPDVREQSAYLLGQLAEMQHRNDEALDWYGQVADDDPHAFDADLRSALILHAQGKVAKRTSCWTSCSWTTCDQPEQLRAGLAARTPSFTCASCKYAKAETAFSRALQVKPGRSRHCFTAAG